MDPGGVSNGNPRVAGRLCRRKELDKGGRECIQREARKAVSESGFPESLDPLYARDTSYEASCQSVHGYCPDRVPGLLRGFHQCEPQLARLFIATLVRFTLSRTLGPDAPGSRSRLPFVVGAPCGIWTAEGRVRGSLGKCSSLAESRAFAREFNLRLPEGRGGSFAGHGLRGKAGPHKPRWNDNRASRAPVAMDGTAGADSETDYSPDLGRVGAAL